MGRQSLEIILKKLGREAAGYILAYDPKGKTHYACRAWFRDETGPWVHSYGMGLREVVEDCLAQVLMFKHGKKEKTYSNTEGKQKGARAEDSR